MPLTKRAHAWLATLRRETPVPTARVERLIIDAGWKPHAVWLDFHDRLAGYIEEVGPGDIAVWGLARAVDAKPPLAWIPPDSVFVRPGDDEFPETIRCADAHPVHEFELAADGWFAGVGGPCLTFDMKVERHGVLHEFFGRAKARQTLLTKDSDAAEHQKLLHDVAPWLVAEASSKDTQFFLTPSQLVQFSPRIKQIVVNELDPP